MSKSIATTKRGQAILTSVVVAETLVREQIELAKLLEQELGFDFHKGLDMIQIMCDELLPGYRGVEKLTVFRRHIRDKLKDEFIGHCTCPPAVRYGVDIPGLGCEVCPHCAEELDKQDIPF